MDDRRQCRKIGTLRLDYELAGFAETLGDVIGFVKWRVIETAGASSSTSGAVGATVVAASGHRDTQPLQCRCKKRWAGAPLPGPYMAHTRTWSEPARGQTMSPATWRRRSPTGPPGRCPSVPPSSTSPMAQRTPMVRLATAFACWLRRPLPYRNSMLMALLSTRRLNFPRHLQDSRTPVGHTPGPHVLVSVRAGRRPICGRPRPRPSTCWPVRRREEHTPLSST